MLNAATQDRYTALPPRTRRARSEDSRKRPLNPPPEDGSGANRAELVGKLLASVDDEQRAVDILLLTFNVDDELNLATWDEESRIILDFDLGRRPSAIPRSDDAWSDSLEILDKNQYLLTPIRKRIFPKVSPSVLRNLLSTPPLRAFTPDQAVLPEDSSLLGSSLQGAAVEPTRPVETYLSSDDATQGSVGIPGHASSFLPSPPPSTELPSLECFSPRLSASGAESSPAPRHLENHDAKRSEPSWDARRSSQGRRSPFPELIPSGLRAAPCSPLLTTRAVVDDSSIPLTSAPTARAKRGSDPRLYAHPGLAFGVVRDFQRVLDELQGLGHQSSASTDDSYAASPSVLQVPWPSLETVADTGGSQGAVSVEKSVIVSQLGATSPCFPLSGQGDGDCACDSSPSGGRLPGPSGRRPLVYPHASSKPSASPGLEDEFIGLLLRQAAGEERQAGQLRAIADRLDRIAQRKKQLAETIVKRQL